MSDLLEKAILQKHLTQDTVPAHFCSDWLKDEINSLFERIQTLEAALRDVRDCLEVYASRSNWYDRTKNNRLEFHDGSDLNEGWDSADEALARISAVLGEKEGE